MEMDVNDVEAVKHRSGPRLPTVIVFLAAFAVIASWLAVYAVTNALVAAELLPPWPRDADPRPRWMLRSFVGLYLGFGLVGLVFRFFSRRQLRRIDAIAEVEDRGLA